MSDTTEEERERSEASPDECQETLEDASSTDDDSFGFEDEYNEAFDGAPVPKVIGSDGLPRPAVEDVLEDAHAPQFLPEENQICVELAHEFVARDGFGQITARFDPKLVTRTPDGRWLVKDDGRAREVEPVRPRCKHYVLQLVPPPPSLKGVLEFGDLHRYCAARRSVAGAFLSLKDAALRACSMRDPVDLASEELLRKFDEKLAEKARKRTYHPMFAEVTREVFGKDDDE